MSSCSAASRREAPPSTRAITRMRMSAEYAFGMVRPPDESMPPDSPTYRSLGTLRFYSARTCSRRPGERYTQDHIRQAIVAIGSAQLERTTRPIALVFFQFGYLKPAR